MWTLKDSDYKKQINPKDPWKDDAWVAIQFVKNTKYACTCWTFLFHIYLV